MSKDKSKFSAFARLGPNYGTFASKQSSAAALQFDAFNSDAEDEHSGCGSQPEHHNHGEQRELLTVKEAADYLRVSKNYLDKLRVNGGGPPFVRLGRRKVIYRLDDLKKWINTRLHSSTSEYGK